MPFQSLQFDMLPAWQVYQLDDEIDFCIHVLMVICSWLVRPSGDLLEEERSSRLRHSEQAR